MRLTAGTLVVVILAILAGLVGAYAVRTALEKPPVEIPPPAAVVVPLASDELPMGRVIAMGDIVLMSMTKEQMTEKNMALDRVMMDPVQIVGRRVRNQINQGQPFQTTDLFLEFGGPDITKLLKPGQRAIQLEIPEVNGSATVSSGTVVDVIFRAEARDGGRRRLQIPETTVTLVESVEVLAVERPRSMPGSDTGGTRILAAREVNGPGPLDPRVTLAVTLEQATILQTVQGRGEILIVPRASGEVGPAGGPPGAFTLEKLLNIQAAKSFETEIFRGVNREVLSFVDGQLAPGNQQPPSELDPNTRFTSTAQAAEVEAE